MDRTRENMWTKKSMTLFLGSCIIVTITMILIHDHIYEKQRHLRDYVSYIGLKPTRRLRTIPNNEQSKTPFLSQELRNKTNPGLALPSTKVEVTITDQNTKHFVVEEYNMNANEQPVAPKQNSVVIVQSVPPINVGVWTHLRTAVGLVDILVYPEYQDIHVSGSLIRTGQWDQNESIPLERLLQCDPELGIIDIGANLGVYVLLAAKYGRQAIGVEPSLESMARLFYSTRQNQFSKFITLIHNAVSDSYTTLQLSANPINRGNTVIVNQRNDTFHVMGEDELKKENRLLVGEVMTILMDDLVPYVKSNRSILKIDIEGSEALAFAHSSKFFSQIDIPYIFMEWIWVQKDPNGAGKFLYELLLDLGYLPYGDAYFISRLDIDYWNWPGDVFWLKGSGCNWAQTNFITEEISEANTYP